MSKDTAYARKKAARKKAARNKAKGTYKCPVCVEMPHFDSMGHLNQHFRSKKHQKRLAAQKGA